MKGMKTSRTFRLKNKNLRALDIISELFTHLDREYCHATDRLPARMKRTNDSPDFTVTITVEPVDAVPTKPLVGEASSIFHLRMMLNPLSTVSDIRAAVRYLLENQK